MFAFLCLTAFACFAIGDGHGLSLGFSLIAECRNVLRDNIVGRSIKQGHYESYKNKKGINPFRGDAQLMTGLGHARRITLLVVFVYLELLRPCCFSNEPITEICQCDDAKLIREFHAL